MSVVQFFPANFIDVVSKYPQSIIPSMEQRRRGLPTNRFQAEKMKMATFREFVAIDTMSGGDPCYWLDDRVLRG